MCDVVCAHKKGRAILPGLVRQSVIFLVLQFANPDVAEADGVAVILKDKGTFIAMRNVVGNGVRAYPVGAALQLDIVLNENTVMKDGESCFFVNLAVFESWFVENNIVGLPLAGFSRCVDKRGGPAVKSGALAVGVCAIVI